MPKYRVNNYFAHGSFPKVGQKQKTEKKERKRERKREKEKEKERESVLSPGDNGGNRQPFLCLFFLISKLIDWRVNLQISRIIWGQVRRASVSPVYSDPIKRISSEKESNHFRVRRRRRHHSRRSRHRRRCHRRHLNRRDLKIRVTLVSRRRDKKSKQIYIQTEIGSAWKR